MLCRIGRQTASCIVRYIYRQSGLVVIVRQKTLLKGHLGHPTRDAKQVQWRMQGSGGFQRLNGGWCVVVGHSG